MLIFSNLLINKNSLRFQPFLVNLISGRRRLLDKYEFMLVKSMINKQNVEKFNRFEIELYNKLTLEKQFMTEEKFKFLENKLIESGYFDIKNIYAEDYRFSVELTRDCNTSCSYCYVCSRLNSGQSMTKNHIDAIYNFYSTYCDDKTKIIETPYIRITGGEPLILSILVDTFLTSFLLQPFYAVTDNPS